MRRELKPANLEVHLSHPTGLSEEQGLVSTLTIRDRDSSKEVARFELTVADFHALLSGRSRFELEGNAYLIAPEHREALGRRKINITRVLPALPYRDDRDDRLTRWANEAARIMGAGDGAGRWSRSNTGRVTVTIVFYGNPEDGFTEEWIEAQRALLAGLGISHLGVN